MNKGLLVLAFGLMFSLTAQARDPVAQMTFCVTDDLGNVVTNASVRVSTFLKWIPGEGFGRDEYYSVEDVTDTNGVVVLEMQSVKGSVSYAVVSTNDPHFDNPTQMNISGIDYYRTVGGSSSFTNAVKGKWQPWNPTVNLVIKKVLNPIPMYAKRLRNLHPPFQIPEYDKAIGFDLMKGDWVAPYGKGEIEDFIFKMDCKFGDGMTSDRYQMYDASLTLHFSNDDDGIQPFYVHPMRSSTLRLPRFAPESGYASNWIKTAYVHKDESHFENREDENYLFRVRTKRDKGGNITNALYGKISGALSFDYEKHISFTFYLNPTPNDRNLEFDPKQNLLKNLPWQAEVQEP
ncbi:MAG: hypothetical protein WC701_09800 [Kiritimatiellales bacterium]|jgi:hypothetical protein